jgi:hypothetical protein
MFSPGRVMALDVSDYEQAEIVFDLNETLPAKYHRIADFIFNGSCLDNLFDPATAIKSLSKMLRPGARVMHLEHGTAIQSAFLCYSPEWFFDFYAINNYADCQSLSVPLDNRCSIRGKCFDGSRFTAKAAKSSKVVSTSV